MPVFTRDLPFDSVVTAWGGASYFCYEGCRNRIEPQCGKIYDSVRADENEPSVCKLQFFVEQKAKFTR
jgi:hypothetical protein